MLVVIGLVGLGVAFGVVLGLLFQRIPDGVIVVFDEEDDVDDRTR